MSCNKRAWVRTVFFLLAVCDAGVSASFAGDGPGARRDARALIIFRTRPRYVPSSTTRSTTLGTFTPTPYIIVGGSNPVGTGYSPLDIYGDQTLALYGPLSPFRATTAPVVSYTRGYDGRLYKVDAASFSYPNLPALSPVIYPTDANNYYGPRVIRRPPWWPSAINWIDQN
jgi:hypothetical protein